MPKKFTLVNWIEEDIFGVMPASAAMISPDKLLYMLDVRLNEMDMGKKLYEVVSQKG